MCAEVVLVLRARVLLGPCARLDEVIAVRLTAQLQSTAIAQAVVSLYQLGMAVVGSFPMP